MSKPKDYDDACRALDLAQRRNTSLSAELGACKTRRDALTARVAKLEEQLAEQRRMANIG